MRHKILMELRGVIKDFPGKRDRKAITVETDDYVKFMKQLETKAEGDKVPDVYDAVISSDSMDRDAEVLIPKGIMLDNFKKNSALQAIHDGKILVIGKVLTVSVKDDEVSMEFIFDEKDPFAAEIKRKYDEGFMKAFSVGFWTWLRTASQDLIDAKGQPLKSVDLPLPEGKFLKGFDLTRFKMLPRNIISGWELLEVSTVNIGSNPDALLKTFKDGADVIKRKVLSSVSGVTKSFVENEYTARFNDLLTSIKEFEEAYEDYKPNGIIPKHIVPICADKDWSSSDAEAELAQWASKDGSGDKDKMDWVKYSQGFTNYDIDNSESFSSYKLCHHNIVDGELVANSKGIYKAFAEILAQKDILDKEIKYNHLVKHLEGSELPIPEFKEYTEDELKAISDGTFEVKEEVLDAEEIVNDLTETTEIVISKQLDELKKEMNEQLTELTISLKTRLNILMDDVKSLLNVKQKEESGNEDLPKMIVDADRFNKLMDNFERVLG